MGRRATVVSAVQVDRTPAEVFAYLSDVARHGDWSPKLTGSRESLLGSK